MICAYRKKDGQPCKREATHGDGCFQHSPATREEAHRVSRQGALEQAGHRLPAPGGSLGRIPETQEDATRLLLEISSAVAMGELDRHTASVMTVAVQAAIRAKTLPNAEAPDKLAAALAEMPDDPDELARIEARLRR